MMSPFALISNAVALRSLLLEEADRDPTMGWLEFADTADLRLVLEDVPMVLKVGQKRKLFPGPL